MAQSEWEVKVVNLKEVQDYIETMPEESFPDAKEAFSKAVLSAHSVVQQMKKLKQPTGALMRSIQTGVSGTNFDTLRASIFSAQGSGSKEVKYAAVHEFGTGNDPIKPINKYKGVRGGPYLNIPTKANKNPAGAMRMPAKILFDKGAKIGGAEGLGVYLKGIKMMTLTKGPIKIKARLGMRDAAEAEIPTLLSNLADVIGQE